MTRSLSRHDAGRAARGWRGAAFSLNFGFVVVFLLALAARLIYLREVYDSPDFHNLVMDSQWYHVEALRIAAGGWMPEDAFFRAPGYPYFLALIYRLSEDGLLAARLVQVVLGSLAASLALWVAWRIQGPWVGWLAGILVATYGLLIYFSAEILATTLVVVTALLALVLLIRADGRRGWLSWFLAGLGLGLSAVVRPTILVFGVLALLWAKGGGSWRTGWGRAGALALGVAVCVSPVTLANYAASGEWVLIAHQGGVNYFVGNNPQADGKTAAGPGEDLALVRSLGRTEDSLYLGAKVKAEDAVGRELTPQEVSRFWWRQAVRFLTRHPGPWAGLQLKKLYYFWNGYEIDNNRNIDAYIRANSPSLRLPHPGFWLIGPLGLVGLAVCFWRSRAWRLVGLFVVGQMVAVVAFFVCARFRMPAAAGLAVLAALGVATLFETVRRGAWRWVAVLAVVLAAASWGVHSRAWGVARDRDVTVHLFNQATAYMEQELYDRAIDTYRQVLDLDPIDAKTHCALGSAYLAKGLYERALPHYNRAISLDPDMRAAAYNDMGVYFLLGNRLEEAEAKLEAALEADAGFELARLNLALVYQRTGREDLALAEYRRILRMADVHPEQTSHAQTEVALSRIREGDWSGALDLLRKAVRLDRANDRARLYLGDALARTGDPGGAADQWRSLVRNARDERVRREAAERLGGSSSER